MDSNLCRLRDGSGLERAGVAATAWISVLPLSPPKCAFMPKSHAIFRAF
jgi:hypothetical protein